MTIFEMYSGIYKDLLNARSEYDRLTGKQQEDAATRTKEEQEERIEKLEKLLEKIEEYRADLDKIMQVVKRHITSLNFLNSRPKQTWDGQGQDDLIQERELNFARLRKWAYRIDDSNPDDPYAQRMYIQIKSNERYLDMKQKEFTEKLQALKNRTVVSETQDQVIQRLRTKAIEKTRNVLQSQPCKDFFDALIKNRSFNSESTQYTSFPAEEPAVNATIMIGQYAQPFPVMPELREMVSSAIHDLFDANQNMILLPLEHYVNREAMIAVSCDQVKQLRAYTFLQHYLYYMIQSFPIGSMNIKVLDAVHYNNICLGELKNIIDSAVMAPIPKNSEELVDALKVMVASFTDIDEEIGFEDSVLTFNGKNNKKDKIQRTTLVLIGYPDAFTGEAKKYADRVINNHERYGITPIIIHTSPESERKEETTGLAYFVDATNIVLTRRTETVQRGETEPQRFVVYPKPAALHEQQVKDAQDAKAKQVGYSCEYMTRVSSTNELPLNYTRGKKKIENIPYAVMPHGELAKYAMENENFASFLMGASGSGKSTLLHTLITGILQNYHPDDVELWLADFKMSEFAQYINPCPPHIKYILLDESRELVYDLMDRLTDEMLRRQRLFMKNHWHDIKEVTGIYLPVIILILDEFSIMSQVLAENEEYRLMLQNLLAKGRALGFKFIFSSQKYTSGSNGLTSMAKDQIQMRLAMKNTYDEINETLDLRSGARTEQVRAWMEALPTHYVMVKQRDGDKVRVDRMQTLYFPGKDKEQYQPQRDLINKINSTLQNRVDIEYGQVYTPVGIDTCVDKHPVIIDGNTFKLAHSQDTLAEMRKKAVALPQNGYQEDDILISVGTPRKLAETAFFAITKENRENVLLVGRNNETACCMSVIHSFMNAFPVGRTHVWAYSRNKLYTVYSDTVLSTAEYNTITDPREISAEICGLREKIDSHEMGNDLYILLGLEQLKDEFDIISKEKPAEEVKEEQTNEQDSLESSETQVDMGATESDEIDYEEDIDWENIDPDNLETLGLGQYYDIPSVQRLNATKPAVAGYNAITDLTQIISNGSRWGYHFVLCLNDLKDLKMTGLSFDSFRHKLVFTVTNDDSSMLFGNRLGGSLPAHTVLHSDGIQMCSYRPYLYKNILWDDWTIDSDTGLPTNTL